MVFNKKLIVVAYNILHGKKSLVATRILKLSVIDKFLAVHRQVSCHRVKFQFIDISLTFPKTTPLRIF
jgi:hypothetical protein